MKSEVIIWLTIAVYIVAMVAVAVISGRKVKNLADITVGGRSAGAWLSALSYGTAYFSAVMFVGYAGGTGLNYGLWGVLAGIGNAVFGSWLAWRVLARRTREVSARLNIKSMPQLFETRYSSKSMASFTSVVIFIFLIPYSASVYKGLASVADVLLGIDEMVCMLVIAAVSVLLLVFGGYLAQARADFVQGIIMMFGVAILIFFVIRCDTVNGIEGIMEYAKTAEGLPELSGSSWLSLISTVLMTSFGTWGLPQMVQKYFGIKDDKQAKRGIVISTFFALLVAGGGYFIGSLCHMFFTSETMPAQDYIVPTMLKLANLPTVLLGVVLVLLISASVSTLCSITLTASSTFSVDIIKKSIRPDMSEKKTTLLTKLACVIFVIVSFVVATTDTPILDMMSYSWGIISGSFLAPYVIALYWKKANKQGAWAGIIGGFVVALVPAACKLLEPFADIAIVKQIAAMGPVFACAAMIISIVLVFGVSKVYNKMSTSDAAIDAKTDMFYTFSVKAK